MDTRRGRFAVSDGVSQSSLPRIWADILTHAFVVCDDIDGFPQPGLPQLFLLQKEHYLHGLDEDARFVHELVDEQCHGLASATFVGIELTDDGLRWLVLGDSCLFLVPDKGPVQCICSDETSTDQSGFMHVSFGSHPHQIASDGVVYGQWKRGSAPFLNGYLLLMTDHMAKWFVNRHNAGDSPLDQLLAIGDNDAFELFVEEQFRADLLESDDETVVLLHIGGEVEELPASLTDGSQAMEPVEDENPSGRVADTELPYVKNLLFNRLIDKIKLMICRSGNFLRKHSDGTTGSNNGVDREQE